MSDLNIQLREYFDATAPPLEVEEVVGDEVLVPGGRKTPSRRWTVAGWAYGMATMIVVLVLIFGLALLLPGGNEDDVVEPTPTTVAPDVETMTDLEVIQAGVKALYSGDAERAVELFGIEDSPVWRNHPGGDDEAQVLDDDLIRREAAYQAAIGGRLTLNCTEEVNTPGVFTCNVPYHNALTDAVGYVDSPGDFIHVVVQDGVITQFALPNHLVQGVAHEFPEHNFLLRTVVSFLREEVEGSEDCWDFPADFLPTAIRTLDCAHLIMDNLDDWAAWYPANRGNEDEVVEPTPTTPVTLPYSILDGEVTFAAAPPWHDGVEEHFEEHFPGFSDTFMRFTGGRDVHVVIATDPLPVLTDCKNGAPADAETLARTLMADPNLETTGTVPVRIAGIEGLQMDVDANRSFELRFAAGVGNPCWGMWAADQIPGRIRLYLIDYPGESAQILTIAVIAPETDFERVLEEATPIVESLEIHTD